jgi:hypothetical protein
MSRLIFYLPRLMPVLTVSSALVLPSCASEPTRVANLNPGYCGGDFGMMEQMQYETRGNPAPVTPADYLRC